MKILYSDKNNLINKKNLFDICEKNKLLLKTQEFTGAKIFEIKINNDTFINKNFNKNDYKTKRIFKIEFDKYMKVKEIIKNDYIFKAFVTPFLYVIECDKNYLILMKKNDYELNNSFIKNIEKKEKINIYLQSIITIFDMNHKNGIFFNDIYYDKIIKNVMINDVINEPVTNINYRLNNNIKILVEIDKYKVQFIDFGYVTTLPKLRTLEYTEKYFKILYDNDIFSEILLFTLFYLTMINKDNDIKKVFDINYKFLRKIAEQIIEYTTNPKDFDIYLISFVYRNINSFL